MSEQTEAGKEFIARVVHELVPAIKRDFWQDDPHNGDVIQHLYFCIEGEPDAYRLAFMRSTLDDCAHPHNTNERHRVEEYIRQKVSTFSAIPADDLRVLCDHGSRQLYPRFDHPFPSFEATSTIRHARVSRCKQTHRAIEA